MQIDQNKLRHYVLRAQSMGAAVREKRLFIRNLQADLAAAKDAAARSRLSEADQQSALTPHWSVNGGLVPQISWEYVGPRRRKRKKKVTMSPEDIMVSIKSAEQKYNEALSRREQEPGSAAESEVMKAADNLRKARHLLLDFERLSDADKKVFRLMNELAEAEADLEFTEAHYNDAMAIAGRCKRFAEQHGQLPADLR